jgi:replicative DNA helicase
MDPLSVLVVDAENDDVTDEWRDLLGLAAHHHVRPEGRLHIVQCKGTEVNLLSEVGQSFLMGWVETYRPAVACLGPIYKLLHRDVRDDESVLELERCLSRASGICHTAWIIEHHAPHKAPTDPKRVMRPVGSSVFMRWPDFGFGLTQTTEPSVYRLEQFRGSRKRTRVWPERLRWGAPNTAEFPWEDAGPEEGGVVIPMRRQG